MTKKELLKKLQTTKTEVVSYFNLSETDLSKTYREGSWNVRQILHHLTDSEMILHTRLKRIIAEPKQVIRHYEQDDWSKAFNYLTEPLEIKKQAFENCRQLNVALIEKFYNEQHWQKEFVHSQVGLRTLKDEFEKIAWHTEQHLDQIRKALGKKNKD